MAAMHSEIKEVVDYFVRALIAKVPRFKVNCFAQELANSLLSVLVSEHPTDSKDLIQNPEGYWIFRQMSYLCPMLLNVLNKCAISPVELMAVVAEVVYFKIDRSIVSSICGTETKVINLSPFKKAYFEIPLRVLKVAIQHRMNMLTYRHTFDGGYPNNFIPLILAKPDALGSGMQLPCGTEAFRAVGLQIYMFSAEQLNKTTFGSHNSAQMPDSPIMQPYGFGPCGDGYRPSVFCESEKIDFFLPSWWERIVTSQIVDDYVEQAKHNAYLRNVLNLVN